MTRITTRFRLGVSLGLVVLAPLVASPARGQQSPLVPIGQPAIQQGIRVAAGYVPGPVSLDPPAPPAEGSLAFHLQVDVDAARGNPYGLDPDDSVPYLRIAFRLTHEPTGRTIEGTLAPMVSRDGFHYGANVVLPAPGAYALRVEIRPPGGLARHTDARTGVAPWWEPLTLTWSFRYPER